MKKSNYSFADGFLGMPSERKRSTNRAFDWDKAAHIIKAAIVDHPDLVAEAGLQGDWAYTGGVIFRKGLPTNSNYTYLSSNWAVPTLILSWDGYEQIEQECFVDENERFNSKTKWDKDSLAILGIETVVVDEED